MPLLSRLLLALLAICWFSTQVLADTRKVYETFKDRLVQIRIIDTESNAKSTLGSGFFVSDSGLIVTNYHVISRLIHHPEQYRAEFVDSDGNDPGDMQLLNIDVVNDLALLRTERRDTPFLAIRKGRVRKGTRLYSLGNPHDLGMTIVEGTYNGYIDDKLHDRIHLTASINPGMSGGPTINQAGEVVGVNVATAGNQIGFLVPANFVTELIAKPTLQAPSPEALLQQVTNQLLANQEAITKQLTAKPIKTKSLGVYQVPDSIIPGLNCWGDSTNEDDLVYSSTSYSCANKHDIFVSERISTGALEYNHHYVSGKDIGRFHFYSLFESYFADTDVSMDGHRDELTAFRCHTDFVKNGDNLMKVALCLRAYTKLEGIHDLVLNAVTVNEDTVGLQSTLSLQGFSFENALAFSRLYLASLAWTK
jgi:hypothetical protein